ncbi:bleomycin resistance family protein [Leptobacterium flavescens]|uniref:Bleomycin resistance family protein n=1 Tax=Leptobacterium flavescens TaxID=472055 RepID=A0A6P0UWC7_9FLAO|nr:VOC family protein [Leptobacterium flavescens]NER15073.1 bleomycin resistance family protein [Leptobacterium flavescens]
MGLKGLSPMLQVDDMDHTIKYYESVLGFKCESRMNDDWARVERDDISIMFSGRFGQGKDQKPVMTGSIYIFTNPVDDLWKELKDKVDISYPIETFDYGMREFAITDCNGYLLQFGQGVE